MTLKRFYHDLALASEASFDNVSNIHKGELNDSVAFSFSHPLLESPVDVEFVIHDVANYLSNAKFMVLASSESTRTAKVVDFLQALFAQIPGNITICGILELVSGKLTAKLASGSQSPESQSFDSLDLDDDYLSDFNTHDELDDETGMQTTPTDLLGTIADRQRRESLKKSLREAQSAGLCIGLFPAEPTQMPEVISLSIRVSQFGLPHDAMEAWGLEVNEHLILLVRVGLDYPCLSKYLELPAEQDIARFRFGKCAAAKPSMESVRAIFRNRHAEKNPCANENGTSDSSSFLPTYMSASINRQLNQYLHRLLALRRARGLSWDAAQEAIQAMEHGSDLEAPRSRANRADAVIISPRAPATLSRDFALDCAENFSIPLVAMQVALRQFVRCTEFCMVCYMALEDGPGSLKPYVCDKPLCLYQYLSLGFGPSIEHEIINSPRVVDLLISFFYSAVWDGQLREFPTVLPLKVPNFQDPTRSIMAQAQIHDDTICIHPEHTQVRQALQPGDCVALFTLDDNAVTGYLCLSTEVTQHACVLEIISEPFEPPSDIWPRLSQLEQSGTPPQNGWTNVFIFPFVHDLEGLPDRQRDALLTLILTCIPPVLDMRVYLLNGPGGHLSSCNRMSRSSLALLEWILASNRSHIVQDQSLTDAKKTPPPVNKTASEPTRGDEPMVQYLPFRFAQGSPDKEHRFARELDQHTVDNKGKKQEFPSLFAWHGSSLGNWHSIIRTGLDFEKVANGRSYGNGVYMSRRMDVSSAYTATIPKPEIGSPSLVMPACWYNSQLRPSRALSLCEIVNRPDQFISKLPHYVVNQVQWIQCRYLYVEVNPTPQALAEPFPGRRIKVSEGYVPQDPEASLLGSRQEPFEVPLAAIPACRRAALRAESREEPESCEEPPPATCHEVESDDLELLNVPGEESEVETRGPEKGQTPAPSKPAAEDASLENDGSAIEHPHEHESASVFCPGTLDHDSLPKLPPPSWASSSLHALHTLTREIKDLHKIQSQTATRDLGWYVDMDKMDNLFHWIVELHSFDAALPLAQDMARLGHASIVLEVRFGAGFPLCPPFVRVVRPRLLPFARGGGGHVTAGGAVCSELLTNSGWSPAMTMEKVLLQVRLGLCELDPPARLDDSPSMRNADYGMAEAAAAYKRAAAAHGWQVPADLEQIAAMSW